jgi:electron transfer flavoprotein beta subunit
VAFKAVIAAKKKKIEQMAPEDLGVNIDKQTVVVMVEQPPGRKPGVLVKDVSELLKQLEKHKLL